MDFTALGISGCFRVVQDEHVDDRGNFVRIWCAREFAAAGLSAELAQCSIAVNRHRGTLRGLHYQTAPYEEAKLVSCIKGAIYDVVVDLRPDSPSYLRWIGMELREDSRDMIYVPPGCAHGYQTLVDDARLAYYIGSYYEPSASRGVRYDDPTFSIEWPLPISLISDRDKGYPDYLAHGFDGDAS